MMGMLDGARFLPMPADQRQAISLPVRHDLPLWRPEQGEHAAAPGP